ncbi:MAG: D-2-hydroxyacid dehydrogenase [Lachnospiraceae bacterium]|nr:D-2-hydroxyacid dehydrogenase [Lachnospiraceae bacterium]
MKTIAVSFPCTREQQNRLVMAAEGHAKVQFTADMDKVQEQECMRNANIIIGEPDLALIRQNDVLEWVQMTWAGTDKYTIKSSDYGFPKHVQLTNMSGAFGIIMSEYAIGAILALYRHFPTYWQQQKNAIWMDAGAEDSLYGKMVLLLGTGDIGSNLAKRLKAFGTTNIGIRRDITKIPDGFDEICGFEQLDELLTRADIVACSLPNKPQTRNLLTKERLLKMKKEAVLLNMGRGGLMDTNVLADVLETGHLKGVVLDVSSPEPLPKEHPLWKCDRVMITPHIAGPSIGHCPATQDRIVDACCENVKRYFLGEALLHKIEDKEFEYIRE